MGRTADFVFILVTFFFLGSHKVTLGQCPSDTVRCNSTSVCLPEKYVCDGDNDCGDGEDEAACGARLSGCGDRYEQRGLGGVISSAGYPVSYSDGTNCYWHIIAPEGYTIILQFAIVFDLEKPRHGDCVYDSVVVYEASPMTLLGRYCGDVRPAPVTISGNEAFVEFQSDDQSTGRGFRIMWSAQKSPMASSPSPMTTTSTTRRTSQPPPCAVEMGGYSGTISSPGYEYSKPYPSPYSCKWTITVDPDYLIALDFSYLNVGIFASSRCQHAWIKLFDGPSASYGLIGQFCDAIVPGELLSTSNIVTVEFWVENNDNNKRGFEVTYNAFKNPIKGPSTTLGPAGPGCDGVPMEISTSTSGFITSPNYDHNHTYRNSLDCEWILTTDPGNIFFFKFINFEVEQASLCDYDYLSIFDVMSPNSSLNTSTLNPSSSSIGNTVNDTEDGNLNLIDKLCGITLPYDIITTSNRVVLRFHTDDQVSGYGFNISYSTNPPPVRCPSGMFQCGSDECLNLDRVCDGVTQCSDGSDEIVCPMSPGCGVSKIQPSLTNDRIVGGEESVDGAWPWTLSLLEGSRHICGATLISPDWAVGAAHCFDSVYSRVYDNFSLMAARHKLGVHSRNEQKRQVADVIIPRDYVSRTSFHDIALIKLKQPFNITDYIAPACLPNDTAPVGTECYATGWGDVGTSCCKDLLKQALLPVMNTSLCSQPDYYGSRIKEGMLCAGYPEGGVDACGGDSGGPFVCPSPDQPGRWELQGITSWGLFCAYPKNPGVYAVVRFFLPWIQQSIATYKG